MDLIPQLLTQIAGGAGASALDKMKPEWVLNVGGTKTGFGVEGTPDGIAITPGAMASIALAALLAFMPGKAMGPAAPTWKVLLANLAGGGLVYEGVKLAEQEIIPRIETAMGKPLGPAAPPALMYGVNGVPGYGFSAPFRAMPYVGHLPEQAQRGYTQYEIQQGLAQFNRAAA